MDTSASAILARVSTHSRPKAAGDIDGYYWPSKLVFQLTAARRRLVDQQAPVPVLA